MKITETEFKALKLATAFLSVDSVAKQTGRSMTAIYRVVEAKDYKQYKRILEQQEKVSSLQKRIRELEAFKTTEENKSILERVFA
ncbi:MAG: hypothetical protein ACYC6W_11725 [Nitrosotalea sp.]